MILLGSCFDSSTDRGHAERVDADRDRAQGRAEIERKDGETSGAESGERSSSNYTQLRNEKRALEARLAELKKLEDRQEELVREEIEVSTRLESARTYLAELAKLEREVETSLEGWKGQTRNSFVGVQLPQVTTIAGDTYEQVEILGFSIAI